MSLISFPSFVLSCASFLQKEESNRLLRSIEHELILIRDRKIKTALSLMNDAKNSSNKSNLDYYIKNALVYFIEAIHSYDADREFQKAFFYGYSEGIRETLDSSLFENKLWKFSSISDRWKEHNENKIESIEWAVSCYITACEGAGICSFYIKEYSNAFNYFDKSLIGTVNFFIFINNNFKDSDDYYRKVLLRSLALTSSEIFGCFNSLEKFNLSNFNDTSTNFYKVRMIYDLYKTDLL